MGNHDHGQGNAGLGGQDSSCRADEVKAEDAVGHLNMCGLASSSYFRPEGASLECEPLLGPSERVRVGFIWCRMGETEA